MHFHYVHWQHINVQSQCNGRVHSVTSPSVPPPPSLPPLRCHQNDLENVIPFLVIGLLYALTGPQLSSALLHFRVFVVSRFCHSVAYLAPLPQPSRALCFVVGLLSTFSMSYRILTTALYL